MTVNGMVADEMYVQLRFPERFIANSMEGVH